MVYLYSTLNWGPNCPWAVWIRRVKVHEAGKCWLVLQQVVTLHTPLNWGKNCPWATWISDVSSPHTADRDHSQWEREMGIGTANQGYVNKPAGQWEPGGKDATLMPSPPPQLESCLRGRGGEVAERGEGRQVKLTQDTAVQRKMP